MKRSPLPDNVEIAARQRIFRWCIVAIVVVGMAAILWLQLDAERVTVATGQVLTTRLSAGQYDVTVIMRDEGTPRPDWAMVSQMPMQIGPAAGGGPLSLRRPPNTEPQRYQNDVAHWIVFLPATVDVPKAGEYIIRVGSSVLPAEVKVQPHAYQQKSQQVFWMMAGILMLALIGNLLISRWDRHAWERPALGVALRAERIHVAQRRYRTSRQERWLACLIHLAPPLLLGVHWAAPVLGHLALHGLLRLMRPTQSPYLTRHFHQAMIFQGAAVIVGFGLFLGLLNRIWWPPVPPGDWLHPRMLAILGYVALVCGVLVVAAVHGALGRSFRFPLTGRLADRDLIRTRDYFRYLAEEEDAR